MRSLLATLLLSCLPAQLPTAEPAAVGSVQLENLSLHARRDVITTAIPMPAGVWRGQPLTVGGRYADVKRVGPAWPDGTARYLRVTFPVQIRGRERRTELVEFGSAPAPAFRYADSIQRTPRMRFGLGLSPTVPERGGAWFEPWRVIETSPLLQVFGSTVRIPGTPYLGRLKIEFRSGLDHARWWLNVIATDGSRPEQRYDSLPPVHFVVRGCVPTIWDYRQKLLGQVGTPRTEVYLKIIEAGRLADGQGVWETGTIAFNPGPLGDLETLKATAEGLPLFAIGGWPDGTWGALGVIRGPPQGVTLNQASALQRASDDYFQHRNGDEFGWAVLGCMPDPNGTGDQADFWGQGMMQEALGWPTRLHAARLSGYQSAARPVHLAHPDGSPYRFDKGELLWHSVIDHRINPTQNRYGKATTQQWSNSRGTQQGRWGGLGWEHWSCLYLAQTAIVTQDRGLLDEVDWHVELLLGTMKKSSASPVLNSMGASRAVGRMVQSGTYLWLATGRPDLLKALDERVGIAAAQWRGRNTAPHRPAVARGPDPRNLGGLYSFSMEWQDSLGALGLWSKWIATGDTQARDLAFLWARNVMGFGIFWDRGRWRAAKATEFRQGGAWAGWQEFTGAPDYPEGGPVEPALTYEEALELATNPHEPDPIPATADPTANFVEFYDGYLLWMMPAAEIALVWAVQQGDAALEKQCREVIAQVLAGGKARPWRTLEWGW